MSGGAYMVDDLTIIRYGGYDSWNQPLATETIPVKGKIEYKTRLVGDLEGERVIAGTAGSAMASAMVRLPECIDNVLFRELMHEDKLKFDGVEHTIIRINTPKAFSSFFVFKYEVFVA